MRALLDMPLRAAELPQLASALGAASLPADDLAEDGVQLFAFRRGEQLVGYGGLELHGSDALLRSILVLPEARGQGIGGEVVSRLLHRAGEGGGRHAYLLTETAPGFFEGLGFSVVERAVAPAGIRATREMATLCPSTATLLGQPIR